MVTVDMKAIYGTMKDILSGTTSRHAGVATAFGIFSSLLLFILIVSQSVTHAERMLAEQLESYADVFTSDDFPGNCNSRHFPHFYSTRGMPVDVRDHDADDWNTLRKSTLQSETFQSAQDSSVHVSVLPCAFSLTPHDANQILVLKRNESTGLRSTGSDFRLTLARGDDALYVLGRVDLTAQDAPPNRFRLRLHYADLTQERFVLRLNSNGELTWSSIDFHYDDAEGNKRGNDAAGRHGTEFTGGWWDSKTETQKRRYIEFRLDNLDNVTAFQVFAEEFIVDETGEGRLASRIGTGSPIPLYEEINAYQITKRLSPRVQYELYLLQEGMPYLLSASSLRSGDTRLTLPAWNGSDGSRSGRLFASKHPGLFYRFYFFVANYDSCPSGIPDGHAGTGICVRAPGSDQESDSYRLRLGKFLPSTKRGQRDRIVLVEETPRIVFWNSMLATGAVFLIVFLMVLLGYASRNRKHTLDDLDRTHAELHRTHLELTQAYASTEKENLDLEQMNMALENYDKIFLHEGRKKLRHLSSRIEGILETAKLQGSPESTEIGSLVSTLTKLLEESTQIFQFQKIVRELISQHGHARFSLVDTVNELVSHYRYDHGYEIRFRSHLDDYVHPMLPATGTLDDPTGDPPDRYLQQALEKVIDNAIQYRSSGTAITVSLAMEGANAVVKVSNKGRRVPQDKLASVFELGTRFTGARGEPEEEVPDPVSPDNGHLGIGLFVCAQIVGGYEGDCRMDNDPDGITVTVRLPCNPAPAS